MNFVRLFLPVFFLSLISCKEKNSPEPETKNQTPQTPFLIVLGTAQDAGYPQAGCKKSCCENFYAGKEKKHFVSCLALIDPQTNQRWIFDCTPDFPAQLHLLDSIFPVKEKILDGIFLTHAHIGHYTGLMHLGREAMNAKSTPVFVMPDMHEFLQSNAPWNLLHSLGNIELMPVKPDTAVKLNERVSVTPFPVPHRDEFTETAGFRISVGNKTAIFIPDIDKWEKWDRDIVQLVKENDYLFLDGTFYSDGEIPGRNMEEIPHPFITKSMALFSKLSENDRNKIYFIHLNHTNPALMNGSDAEKDIERNGFHLAKEMTIIKL